MASEVRQACDIYALFLRGFKEAIHVTPEEKKSAMEKITQQAAVIINSQMLAAEAAAIEMCAEHADIEAAAWTIEEKKRVAENIAESIRAELTPARKSALEARMLEARKREHIEQEWERLWPPEKDKSICAWGPKCVRCAELDRQLAALRKENGNG